MVQVDSVDSAVQAASVVQVDSAVQAALVAQVASVVQVVKMVTLVVQHSTIHLILRLLVLIRVLEN